MSPYCTPAIPIPRSEHRTLFPGKPMAPAPVFRRIGDDVAADLLFRILQDVHPELASVHVWREGHTDRVRVAARLRSNTVLLATVPALALCYASSGCWGDLGDAIRNLRWEGTFPPPKPRPFRLRRRPR